MEEEEKSLSGNILYLVYSKDDKDVDSSSSMNKKQYRVICASFGKGKYDNLVYAVTKCGCIIGYEIQDNTIQMLQGRGREYYQPNDAIEPMFVSKIPNGTTATQIVANERFVLVNSSDALRLYDVEDLRAGNKEVIPEFVFQDPVSKAPWVSCDFLLDEYIVVSESI